MWDALLWIYLINATLLITHEIDSAYWREWELFRLPGGIAGFLAIHLPLVFLIVWGAALTARQSSGGLLLSAALGISGIAAFAIHLTFILRGRTEFKTFPSLLLLCATLVVSVIQCALVAYVYA
ncbi:MAG: hypothetical protein FJ118_20825 [Deltaproteobacteria bacterium]|nr:hypothetical protein [Deltaproteobacteria bacterium]